MGDLLSLKEAMDLTGVSRPTILKALHASATDPRALIGRLIGGRWFIEVSDAVEWKAGLRRYRKHG